MGDRSLTYSELNAYSNRIARTILNRRGSGSEPIALLFEHGIDVIAAIFGVLKAGKFYLVLDPTSPVERLSRVLKDSQASILISNYDNANLSQKLTSARLQHLNTDELDVVHLAERFEHLSISADALVNITYTSGSTGNPKGVTRLHGRVLQSALLSASTRSIDERDKFSLVHSASFGSASTEVFQSLLNGAALCLFDIKKKGVREFANFLKHEGITVCHLSPATFRVLVRSTATLPHFSKLRLLYLSGAPITRTDHELYKQKLPRSTSLEVAMGSTEAGYICHAFLDHDFCFPNEGTPIGYAAPGKKVFILDEALREVSIGEIGQIAVRGANLNPGYWRRPDLTRNRYLADPDGGDEQMYLTGDLGRMLPDGFVIHLGRKDLMVKVRGYRLNIGDVENALLEHPNVREVGVAAWERDPGEKYLVGYVVANPDSAPNVSDLRDFLSNKLPDYMVPSAFIFLDSLPLTNGKLDRSALPKPDNIRPGLNVPYVAPRTRIEQTLSKIWSELLSVDRVGVDDNFFDLGGQSLAGAAILTRVKETLGVELAVSDLLDRPTVALMAEAITRDSTVRAMPQPPQGTSEVTIAPTHSGPQSSDSLKSFPREEVEQSIPERFEKIARLYPERIAIDAANRILTYSELNAMANRVARSIVAQRGNKPEPVALLIDKGVEQIAAMLGILKAGKFFVPLDSSYPSERISSILRDSQAVSLIVDRQTDSIAQRIAAPRCHVILFDAMHQANPAEKLRLSISPCALACIVYTSGSTGKPKGVIRNHRALLHSAMLRVHTDGISSDDRLAHITAGTSNAVTNAFYALLQGAALVMFDVKQQGVARLASWLVDEKITICLIASPVFRKLCAVLTGAERFPHLRYLRLRSDMVHRSDVELHRQNFSSTCVLATGLSSSETGPLREYRIAHDTEFPGPEVPVGYALRDKEILLVDDHGREVGFNEIGEIVVRSEFLSLGYWNNPQLTAARFKPDPRDPEKYWYYTGDLGLMLPDGCLIHKGRKDFRIKIRGYGVDLVEVERTLLSCRAVKEVVVVAQSEEKETRLVAYYTTQTEPSPTASELRRYLQSKLADYMIPSAFVRLDALPLTLNGKIDRKALPEPPKTRPELGFSYVSPKTVIEERLAALWAEVLSVDQVGLHDNFFDLGGHSLVGAAIISRVKETFGVEMPVSDLFRSPTVLQLAERINLQNGAEPHRQLRPSNEGTRPNRSARAPQEATFAAHVSKEVEQSIPASFEETARTYSNHIAVMPDGKIDRATLIEPYKNRPELDVTYVAPRTTAEHKLARIWADVLLVERVGLHDNFFNLGGHSLSAVRLVSWIHEVFHFDLTVSEFFATPTIAQLSERIEAGGKRKPRAGTKTWTYLCEIQRGTDRRPVFVFPGGGGGEPEFFVYGFLARHVGTEYPVYGLRARGSDGTLKPHTSVEQMADAYVEEIRAIQPEGPYFLVGECAGGANAYEAARQLSAQGQEIAILVLMDVERPMFIKYLDFRTSRWLKPSRFWNEIVCVWWRENYYIARVPYHVKQLRSLALKQYPAYFLGRLNDTVHALESKLRAVDARRERAAVVLNVAASGRALRHIKWVRENYRRTVRLYRPKSYDGHIEILVSEKLHRRDPTLGWKKLALKGLSVHPLPGDHDTYIRDHAATAGLKLRECLERAEKELTSRGGSA